MYLMNVDLISCAERGERGTPKEGDDDGWLVVVSDSRSNVTGNPALISFTHLSFTA
jgi:hypothetical protein